MRAMWKWFRLQMRWEVHLWQRRRDRKRLRHLRMSWMQRATLFWLVVLMLLAMVLGCYLGQLFKGRTFEVRLRQVLRQERTNG